MAKGSTSKHRKEFKKYLKKNPKPVKKRTGKGIKCRICTNKTKMGTCWRCKRYKAVKRRRDYELRQIKKATK